MKQDKCPKINFMRIYTFFFITFVHAFTRKLRPQAPEKFRPSGCIENSDPRRTHTLQVYQKLRPSGYIKNSHPWVYLKSQTLLFYLIFSTKKWHTRHSIVMFLPHFDVFHYLLLNRCRATWNLFALCIK